MIDLNGFAKGTVARAKTQTPQSLEVPKSLRPVLRAWWVGQGSPKSGPASPACKGPRAGDFKFKRTASLSGSGATCSAQV